ncbi:chemotaxis protein CheV [Sinimarinibacterium sp. NLF-5-8]|uniref:chemotaxis protein CheV n=1 Tax=Sinimarinibacterium sp. NLF-5-8 TaxID=2698684 RepID=UPI00137BBF6E|nr:chemotaxis protein CheV [Sinimarinibacterium sp. NLF-5-8]QHS11067.1 chemotaxis protein CheV [Sinimarinibacterium sp. NLF-5-8]
MAYGLLESIDRSTQLAGHNRLALLLFHLGPRQVFGINVFKVQEVIRTPPLSPMPGAHPFVAGVADIRGRIVPVIDLQLAIGAGALGQSQHQHVIVAEFNRTIQGFLVSGVDRIVHIDVAHLQPPPSGASEGYLTAITRFQERLVEIIDVEKVLSEVVGRTQELSAETEAQARQINVGELKVLIADDSRVARNQIERVLSQMGIDCIQVADGREALQQLQRMAEQGPLAEQLLMVISDVEMPNMDGYTLTTEIRRDPRLKDLYVMLHTSLSGIFNNAMVERVGADRFVAKFSSNELAEGVMERMREVQEALRS